MLQTKGDARPVARDFAKLAELTSGQLLLFGGLDASERRLDDTWVLDTARSSAHHDTLLIIENTVLIFLG